MTFYKFMTHRIGTNLSLLKVTLFEIIVAIVFVVVALYFWLNFWGIV